MPDGLVVVMMANAADSGRGKPAAAAVNVASPRSSVGCRAERRLGAAPLPSVDASTVGCRIKRSAQHRISGLRPNLIGWERSWTKSYQSHSLHQVRFDFEVVLSQFHTVFRLGRSLRTARKNADCANLVTTRD